MYLTSKNKSILLAVSGVLFSVFIISISLWFLVREKTIENKINETGDRVAPVVSNNIQNNPKIEEPLVLRSQADISREYQENIEKMIAVIKESQQNNPDMLEYVENGLFNIFVPNNMIDAHAKAYLDIRKIITNQMSDDTDVKEIRKRLLGIFTSLAEQNSKNNL